MAEEAKSQSWWQTLPGVLTAIAAGITATSGLIAAIYQAGLIGKKEQPSASSAAPVSEGAGKTASQATIPAPPPAAASESPVQMPDGSSVTIVDDTGRKFQYTIVTARREQTSSQKQLLRLRVRVWTSAAEGVVFWSDSFRLKIGELILKPINSLDVLAAQNETKDGDVEFEVDASVQEAVLAINVGGLNFQGNNKELRLKLA